jgi:hypothetical protein
MRSFYILLIVFPLLAFSVPPPANRLPSTPFITGDTFRFFADYAYDELDRSLDPKQIQTGNTIFVKTDYLGDFFQKIHPYIICSYILISHNSDDPAPGKYIEFLKDDKLLAWFAQNYDGYSHPKMHPIPIGIANFHWKHGNFQQILKTQKKKFLKRHLAYLNINIQTFSQERKKVVELLSKEAYCYQKTAQNYKNFLKDIAAASFVISPRGNGLDTHRLWEALYLGSIPVVKTSSLDPLYEGLPVLIISDWEEVTENFLKKHNLNFFKKQDLSEKLFINYWIDQINKCRLN